MEDHYDWISFPRTNYFPVLQNELRLPSADPITQMTQILLNLVTLLLILSVSCFSATGRF